MKYLLTICLMLSSLSAFASINTTGLSPQQIAEFNLQIENAKAQSTFTDVDTAEKVSKWVSIGKDMGVGLAATAKELGVTANELADTPVGIIAIVVIVWNYLGNDLIGFVFGFLWFATTIPIWVWLYRARFVLASIEYYDKGKREDGLRKVKTYRTGDADENVHIFYWITLVLIVVTGMFATFL